MRHVAAIMLLLFLLLPLSATWARPGVARLEWSQPAGIVETCLIRIPAADKAVLVACWPALPAGATVLHLGASGPLDARYRPVAGDGFALTQDGVLAGRVQLRGVGYVPLVRR